MRKIVLIVFVVLTLTGCVSVSFSNVPDFDVISETEISSTDNVVIQELTYDESKFESYYANYYDMTKENGLYKFSFDNKKSYILFLSKGTEYTNIVFDVVGNDLIVTYESSKKEGANKSKLFAFDNKGYEVFDTIVLKNNGEEDHFQMSAVVE
ncbi:MAG: hypothetical protein RR595_12655 [Lysinibacillus sp.]